MLDTYCPNSNNDIKYYSIMFDGSSNFPLYQSIPNTLYFDIYEEGTISQLNYKERKTDKYFDTSIALKKDVNESTDMLLQVESKSIETNINQNAFLNFKKNTDNLSLDISYLYHYEDDPDLYSLLNSHDSSKELESFNSGIDVTYTKNKFLFKSELAFQTSYVNRPIFDQSKFKYDSQTTWSNIYFDYLVSKSMKVYIENKYKKNIFENHSSSTMILKDNYTSTGLGAIYSPNSTIDLKLGSDIYNKTYKPIIGIKYKMDKIQLSLNANNFIIDDIQTNDYTFESYNLDFTSKKNLSINMNFNLIATSIELGEIKNSSLIRKVFKCD